MHRVVCSVPLPSFPLTTGGGCFIFPLIRWYSTHGGNYLRVWVKGPSWEISTQEYYSVKIYHHVMGKHVICLILQKKWGIFKSVKEDGCNTIHLCGKECRAFMNPNTRTPSLQSWSSRWQGPGAARRRRSSHRPLGSGNFCPNLQSVANMYLAEFAFFGTPYHPFHVCWLFSDSSHFIPSVSNVFLPFLRLPKV